MKTVWDLDDEPEIKVEAPSLDQLMQEGMSQRALNSKHNPNWVREHAPNIAREDGADLSTRGTQDLVNEIDAWWSTLNPEYKHYPRVGEPPYAQVRTDQQVVDVTDLVDAEFDQNGLRPTWRVGMGTLFAPQGGAVATVTARFTHLRSIHTVPATMRTIGGRIAWSRLHQTIQEFFAKADYLCRFGKPEIQITPDRHREGTGVDWIETRIEVLAYGLATLTHLRDTNENHIRSGGRQAGRTAAFSALYGANPEQIRRAINNMGTFPFPTLRTERD